MVARPSSAAAARVLFPVLSSRVSLPRRHEATVLLSSKLQRRFSTTIPASSAQNRIFDSVRDPASLHTLLLLSSSTRTPLITFWKTSWCSSCAAVAPLIHSLISSGVVPNSSGGRHVGYAEIELDAPDMADLGLRYSISSVPTLMAFDRQEAQVLTRVTDVNKLKNEAFLREWIDSEASRGGAGGAGGSMLGGLSGWFGGGS